MIIVNGSTPRGGHVFPAGQIGNGNKKVSSSKVAVTVASALIVTVQGFVLVQPPPDHLENMESVSAVALRVTVVPVS